MMKSMNNIKSSFIGDLMCDQALLEAANRDQATISVRFSGLTELSGFRYSCWKL